MQKASFDTNNIWKKHIYTLLRVIVLLSISILPITSIYVFRDQIENLGLGNFYGLFLLTFLNSSGTVTAGVPLPIPGLVMTFLAGSILNPWKVGLVAGLGAGLGEIFSYPIGVAGRTVAKNRRFIRVIERWINRYGGSVVFIGAALPNPLFDFVGLAAGLSGYSFWKFAKFVILGRLIRAFVFAYLGFFFADFIGFSS